MVSRRIEAAQKKVEERHFDARKNLLEYDEVMDHQRKEVYGYRQDILEGANCKTASSGDDRQADRPRPCERYLDSTTTAPASFAEFAANRLGVEFDAADFSRSDFTEAEKTARDKAMRGRRDADLRDDGGEPRQRGLQGVELAGDVQPGQRALEPQDERSAAAADRQGQHGRLPARAGQQVHRRDRSERGPGFPRTGLGRAFACATGRV